MRWFSGPEASDGTGPPAAGAFVSVLRAADRLASGGGTLLAERHFLTCAHVVNEALGKEQLAPDHPGGAPVEVALPYDGGPQVRRTARVVHWVPPQRAPGALEWSGDLAVLELDVPVPGVPPRWTAMARGQRVRAWHGGGHPATFVDATVRDCDHRIGYVDGTLSGAAIGPGYSGGPLWSERDGAVVGVVAAQLTPPAGPLAAGHVIRRGWAIPWQVVRGELERAGLSEMPAVREAPEDEPVPHQLLAPLATLLADPADRADTARRLAEQCGLRACGEGAPSYEELARVLTRYPRALPTLTEALAPAADSGRARDALNALHACGAVSVAARLLSYGEHRSLLEQLAKQAGADPVLLPAAARGALAYAELPEPVRRARIGPEGVAAAVFALEELGDSGQVPAGTPRVPALLRVTEYVAAAVADRSAGGSLRTWSDQVADRLGIHPAALRERRADAAAWTARRHRGGSRTVVRLTRRPEDPPDRHRCTVWRIRGDGTVSRASTGEDVARGKEEIARLVSDAVPPDETGDPLVEVVVDREELRLPVDEWRPGDASGDGFDDPHGIFAPSALGAEFRLVLRCPALRHRSPTGAADHRRRWAGSRTEPALVVGEHLDDVRALKEHLSRTEGRGTGRVVLRGDAARLDHLLQLCLFLGVPVVLWDRDATGPVAFGLDALEGAGPPHSLPERVRDFRVGAYGDPATTARPSLVWDDPHSPLPGELRLADPAAMEDT